MLGEAIGFPAVISGWRLITSAPQPNAIHVGVRSFSLPNDTPQRQLDMFQGALSEFGGT